MKEEEIEKYRDKIDQQLKEKTSEIESNIAYIIVGALGFFLTINEKFIGLRSASFKFLLFLSIILLLVAFFLFLLNKHLTTVYDRKLIDILDKIKPEDEKDDKELLHNWEKFDKVISGTRKAIYLTLFLGIVFEIVFFMTNTIQNKTVSTNKSKEKVVLDIRYDSIKKNHFTISIDTLTK